MREGFKKERKKVWNFPHFGILESLPIPEAVGDAAPVSVFDWTGVDAGFE